jgi:hypothetical protein
MASAGPSAAWSVRDDVRTLYAIIEELRQKYTSPAATRALDIVLRELGQTHDNLKEALERVEGRPLPAAAQPVLSELKVWAWLAGVDDLRTPPPPDESRGQAEPLDWGDLGIGITLGLSALVAFILALLVTIRHTP